MDGIIMAIGIAQGNQFSTKLEIVSLSEHTEPPRRLCSCPVCGDFILSTIAVGMQNSETLTMMTRDGDGWQITAPPDGWRVMNANDPHGVATVTVFSCRNEHVICERRQRGDGGTFVSYRAFSGPGVEQLCRK